MPGPALDLLTIVAAALEGLSEYRLQFIRETA